MTFVQRIGLFAMFCALVEGTSVSRADNGKRLVETSVKVLRTTVPAPQVAAVRAARRPPATPTTPGAKYPQYQLSHPQNPNSNADESAYPRLRFFLNLPNETLLVEVKITIDDLPFPMVRRNRVERILRELVVGKDIPLPIVEKKATARERCNRPATSQLSIRWPPRRKHLCSNQTFSSVFGTR